MAANPEDEVLANINALISDQLAAGPTDDYSQDYYPKCGCGHDWHGLACATCGCLSVEEAEQLPELHRQQARRRRGGLVLTPGEARALAPGYTLADLEAMRWRREREGQWSDYPQRYVLGQGQQGRPRLRFWQFDLETNCLMLTEVTAEVLTVEWHEGGGAIRLMLDPPVRTLTVDQEDPLYAQLPEVARELANGMVAVENETPGGFVHVGNLAPEDIEIEHQVDTVQAFGGRLMRTHDSYTARFTVTDDALLRRIFGYDSS